LRYAQIVTPIEIGEPVRFAVRRPRGAEKATDQPVPVDRMQREGVDVR